MFKKIIGLWFPSKGKNKKDVQKYIDELVASGAGEFFTGYNPRYWSEKFGFEVSPNGRFAEHEQITDFETLKQVVEAVHSHNLEVFININAWYYTDETFPLIKKMLWEFSTLNIDGIICGNIWILEHLKETWYTGKINISTILAVYNSQAISFLLENYTVNKIILGRELTLKEIEHLVTSFPEVDFEVFWEGDFCRYNNGLCYAEHKYWAKDICTIVVNDLIYKKKFRADFKKILTNEDLSNIEKVQALSDEYQDVFEQVQELLDALHVGLGDKNEQEKTLEKILYQSRNRVDLYFDGMKPLTDERNTKIFTFFKGLKYIWENNAYTSPERQQALETLTQEVESSIQAGMKYLKSKIQWLWGLPKLRAQELASFYAKGDILNLYSYLFFSRFPNINTVKFPTRGRNYGEKIQLIERVLQEGKVDETLIDRGISMERTHYDLTYLFWDKLWFRELLQES